MKTHAPRPPTGILASICLLAGIGLLNSCATKPIELARGTHWRDAAKVAGQPTVSFSYQMNGRKYDRVKFGKLEYPVVLENGRILLVDTHKSNAEWNRCFNECVAASELPFENGFGPLHSLVMEQKLLDKNQVQSPNQSDLWEAADSAGSAAIMLAALPFMAGFYLGIAMDEYAEAKERQNDRQSDEAANAALLDAGVSYENFLNLIGQTDRQAKKGAYRVGIYYVRERHPQIPATYTLATRNGRVVWVAPNCEASNSSVLMKLANYLHNHR